MQADTSIVLTFFVGALLFIVLAVAIILSLVQYKKRQIYHVLEKAALQHSFENQLLQSKLEVQEQSFQYFSEEIHDNVGQVLSVAGMQLYQLIEECKAERELTLAQQCSDLLNKAINDLRTISHTLNGQFVVNAGIIETLRQEINYINSVKGPTCRLEIVGEAEDLSADRKTLLFRILQESINNAVKHAKATEIVATLDFSDPGKLSVNLSDNGEGFDLTGQSARGNGIGLSNMKLRAGLLGGELQITRNSGRGTSISLTIETMAANAT